MLSENFPGRLESFQFVCKLYILSEIFSKLSENFPDLMYTFPIVWEAYWLSRKFLGFKFLCTLSILSGKFPDCHESF